MSPLRSLLAHALAALLLLQWAAAPAHCLAMAALADGGAVICHADDGTPRHSDGSGGVPVSPDQSCPACHALGHAALTPAPPAVPELVAWSAPTPPPPRLMADPAAPRARPQQPRAPPALSV
jgi:hypothetical protein